MDPGLGRIVIALSFFGLLAMCDHRSHEIRSTHDHESNHSPYENCIRLHSETECQKGGIQ
jgi:hypothetical protein